MKCCCRRKRYTRRPYKRVQLAPPCNNPKEPQTASPDNQLNDSAVIPARDSNTSPLLDQEDESLSSDEQAEVEDEEAGVSTPDEESDSAEDIVSEEDVVE